jgi:hypothetical protein
VAGEPLLAVWLQGLLGLKTTWKSNGDILASIVTDKECATAYLYKPGTFEVRRAARRPGQAADRRAADGGGQDGRMAGWQDGRMAGAGRGPHRAPTCS